MKVLLTGATGLVGKEVGKCLTEKGHEVIALSRRGREAQRELPFQAQSISFTEVASAGPFDAVINLMGENLSDHRWTQDFKAKLRQSRIDLTRSLLKEISKSASPSVWIQASAIGFYGPSKSGEVLDESSPQANTFLATLCAEWEQSISELPSSTRQVILRTGVVFSHQGGAFNKMLTPLLNGVGGVIGSGDQEMSLIHLKDVARFVLHALEEQQVNGVYNLVSKEPISQKCLTEKLCEKLHVSQGPPAPAVAIKLLFGEMSDLLLTSQAVVPTRFKEARFQLSYDTVDSILDEIVAWYQHPFQKNKSVFIQYSEQYVPRPLLEVFPFFSEAKNLEKITPEFLNFTIRKMSTDEIKAGTKIFYRLKLHGIPFGWLTLIQTWEPPHRFVDQQMKGPYTLWFHEHRFEEVKGGTLMKDWVRFELPCGKLGQWFGLNKVQNDVKKIFAHRREVISNVFKG